MELLVFTPHFLPKRLREMHNDKNNTIAQIREKTNAPQDHIEFER